MIINPYEATQEKTTSTENQYPQQIVTETTKRVVPPLQVETAQGVYNKRKSRIINNRLIWYILIIIEVLLTFRVILNLSGAYPLGGFPLIIYTITSPLVYPFSGIYVNIASDSWATIFAGIVYLSIAWGVIYLLHIIHPITPKDIETQY